MTGHWVPSPHQPSNYFPQGMDVVGYYATYGHSARIKMFHCMGADLTGTDCPYELVVVPKEAIKGDYHTVSASGVVQVIMEGWGVLASGK